MSQFGSGYSWLSSAALPRPEPLEPRELPDLSLLLELLERLWEEDIRAGFLDTVAKVNINPR